MATNGIKELETLTRVTNGDFNSAQTVPSSPKVAHNSHGDESTPTELIFKVANTAPQFLNWEEPEM